MLDIYGTNIEKLPFEGLKEIGELMSFQDNPLLIHFQSDNNTDLLGYWVDFDESGHRWLYTSVSKKELFDFC